MMIFYVYLNVIVFSTTSQKMCFRYFESMTSIIFYLTKYPNSLVFHFLSFDPPFFHKWAETWEKKYNYRKFSKLLKLSFKYEYDFW